MRIETINPYDQSEFEYVRIDDGDAYGMYMTLARIILPMLRVLQRNKQGVPGEFAPDIGTYDVQGVFAFIDEDECERALDRGGEKWAAIVDEMIWAFDAVEKGVMDQPQSAQCKRAQNGLNLFAKYYRNLWT
jgi:hypothetical protein